jgi:hypothetical protein
MKQAELTHELPQSLNNLQTQTTSCYLRKTVMSSAPAPAQTTSRAVRSYAAPRSNHYVWHKQEFGCTLCFPWHGEGGGHSSSWRQPLPQHSAAFKTEHGSRRAIAHTCSSCGVALPDSNKSKAQVPEEGRRSFGCHGWDHGLGNSFGG